jgi:hypothetical protein
VRTEESWLLLEDEQGGADELPLTDPRSLPALRNNICYEILHIVPIRKELLFAPENPLALFASLLTTLSALCHFLRDNCFSEASLQDLCTNCVGGKSCAVSGSLGGWK